MLLSRRSAAEQRYDTGVVRAGRTGKVGALPVLFQTGN